LELSSLLFDRQGKQHGICLDDSRPATPALAQAQHTYQVAPYFPGY
jgi:hypothetical protein